METLVIETKAIQNKSRHGDRVFFASNGFLSIASFDGCARLDCEEALELGNALINWSKSKLNVKD